MIMEIKSSQNVQEMLNWASQSALECNAGDVATEFLMYGITCLPQTFASKCLAEFGVTRQILWDILAENKIDDIITKQAELSPRSKQVFAKAENLAKEVGSDQIEVEHILFAILMSADSVATNILQKVCNVNVFDLKAKILNHIKQNQLLAQSSENLQKTEHNCQKSAQNQQNNDKNETYKPDEIENLTIPKELVDLGIDLTQKARNGKIDPIIGRDKEIDRVIEILCRKTKNNPCLIGEAGVGKSAIVEGLALKIVNNQVPDELKNKTIFSFDISGLMAGTKFRGALEQKLKSAINAIVDNKNIIVFMDEIHTLVETSNGKGEVSPADILKPYLARGEFKTIGATTTEEYTKFLEKDKALERRFQPVDVKAPSKEDTYKILLGIRESYEAYHGVLISDEALHAAIDLSDRYITNRNFPDKAIDLIDEASSRAKLFGEELPPDIAMLEEKISSLQKKKRQAVAMENYETAITLREQIFELTAKIEDLQELYGKGETKKVIVKEDIAAVISLWTKIPVQKLTETEAQKLLNLENILHQRVIGQDEAVQNVCRAVRRSRVGIKSNNRPIGSFLFLGPTGVGKTELAKTVAETLFDDEKNMIRIDMSEYMEANSVSRLIGSPPGYVGYGEGGELTEKVRKMPYSVVLFDEIEKANNDVLNLLLQIFDDGRLTDSQGRVVSFQNTIVILTSNIGGLELQQKLEGVLDNQQREQTINSYLKGYLRPELINRIDNISVFASLSKQSLAKIAKVILVSLGERLKERNIELRLTENALSYLITKGYSAEFGARPLRRLIEQGIEEVISDDILRGKLKNNYYVIVDEQNGKLDFEYRPK